LALTVEPKKVSDTFSAPLIAAHAVALGVPLATGNRNEFERLPGLDLADWP